LPISASRAQIVIADAGPLIALGRLDQLALLPALFVEVQVTETVLAECLARPDLVDAQRIAAALSSGWLKRCQDVLPPAAGRLDPGESSAIARALEIGAGLLLDDRAAVVFARGLGLKVIGTLGILVLAKRRNKVAEVAPMIERLQQSGHYLSDGAILAALKAADEA
jgi:predicted nucleic acid-binding protein